jgi:hypothetical protein
VINIHQTRRFGSSSKTRRTLARLRGVYVTEWLGALLQQSVMNRDYGATALQEHIK